MLKFLHQCGHIVKHSPEIIREKYIINKLKNQSDFKTISDNENKEPKVIVSLTSYKKRFPTLSICLKSIFNQTVLPDKLILFLSKDESYEDLPDSVKDLQKYGLEIKFVDGDLKPHKKYYYAMQSYPNDIVITLDDDLIYDPTLLEELLKVHKRFPNCVVAARAHEITFKNGKIDEYINWNQCSTDEYIPSFKYMATEGAGALYPPHLLNLDLLLDLNYVNKYINVDDLWLKAVEVVSEVPVVICNKKLEKNRIEITSAQKNALANKNVGQGQNDIKIMELDKDFNLLDKLKKDEEKVFNRKL